LADGRGLGVRVLLIRHGLLSIRMHFLLSAYGLLANGFVHLRVILLRSSSFLAAS
jgi:hypothetical protein